MFTRKIVWRPAFDKRHKDPKKNCGIHGAEFQFQLIGPDGGVTFTVFTNWMLPHVQEETDRRAPDKEFPYLFHKPQPAGVDGHWKIPSYEWQTPIKDCLITGGDCYCDGSALLSTDIFNLLVAEGEEPVWAKLEELYNSWKPTTKEQQA